MSQSSTFLFNLLTQFSSYLSGLSGLASLPPPPPPPSSSPLRVSDPDKAERFNTSHVNRLISHPADFRHATRFTIEEAHALAGLLGVDMNAERRHYMFTPFQRLVLFLEVLALHETWASLELHQKRSEHPMRDDFKYWVHEIVTKLSDHPSKMC